MRIIKKVLRQTAVYWAPPTQDENGEMTYGSPVEIKCRWEDIVTNFIDTKGDEQTSSAVVMVDRDINTKGVLWLGLLTDAQPQPFDNPGAYEIKKFDKLPDFKAKDFVRTAYL